MSKKITTFPTLDIVPADYRKAAILTRYRRAITDERLDQMHGRVLRNLEDMLNKGELNKPAFDLASIEAERAYGARQEEFDNPTEALLKKRAKQLTEAPVKPATKVVSQVAHQAAKCESSVEVVSERKVLSIPQQRKPRAVNLSKPMAANIKPAVAATASRHMRGMSSRSSWATAEAEMKRLLNQMHQA